MEIEAPDGTIIEFPEGTSHDVIKSVMQKQFGAPQAQVQQPKQQESFMPSWVGDLPRQAIQGATLGTADEILAGLNTLVKTPYDMYQKRTLNPLNTVGDRYNSEKTKQDAILQVTRDRQGALGTAAELLGGIATGGSLAKAGATFMPKAAGAGVGRIAAGAAGDGAAYGALTGFNEGSGLEDRLTKGAIGSAVGAAAGGLVGAGAGKLAQRSAAKTIPTTDQIDDMARAAYQKADDAGLVIKGNKIPEVKNKYISYLTDEAYHPKDHPRIATLIERLDEVSGQPITLKGADRLRKAAVAVTRGGEGVKKEERRMAGELIGQIDDMLSNLNEGDLVMGNKEMGVSAIKEARKLWKIDQKSSKVDELIYRAELQAGSTGSGGNINNATKQQLKKVLTSRLGRDFSQEEKAVIEKLVLGSKTGDALRLVGKLSPSGNGLMTALGIGGAATNPALAAFPVAGYLAKAAADAGTKSQAGLISAMIRNGGVMPQAQLSQIQKGLLGALLSGGAAGGNNLSRR